MGHQVTLGGERIGSGNQMKVSLHNYERSTHDTGFVVKTTMAPGVLTPFMAQPMLPGSTKDIDLSAMVFTLPTVGPMFGLYKIEMHLYKVPVRLYQAALHLDMTEIGNNMQLALLPLVEMEANRIDPTKNPDNQQINPSSIWSHLGIRGLGQPQADTPTAVRRFQATTLIGYWDIYKRFYANKQEEIGAVIHTPLGLTTLALESATLQQWAELINGTGSFQVDAGTPEETTIVMKTTGPVAERTYLEFVTDLPIPAGFYDPNEMSFQVEIDGGPVQTLQGYDIFDHWDFIIGSNTIRATIPVDDFNGVEVTFVSATWSGTGEPVDPGDTEPIIETFPLTNIDDMRMSILQHPMATPFIIDADSPAPYGLSLQGEDVGGIMRYSKNYSLEGLGLKCYQSDLFNNWLQTEWIDAINTSSSIDTTGNSFTMEAFLLGKKMYEMNNRIAISGGTYDDWLDAAYTHERRRAQESPEFLGGMQDYISFEEVVSNSATTDQPLGTLAGRGQLHGSQKGGKVIVRADEHCYIIGIASITPQLDYSQGNTWDANLKTMDDWHKPGLDGIGWQDLITDQMAYWDTQLSAPDVPVYKSAGKQPAWINYQTNVNRVRGAFADVDQQMFMVLNRRYVAEYTVNGEDQLMPFIGDLTTYIDPTKFNHIFADTRRDAQNFWVQIGVKMTSRIKMSANQIPNL